MDFQELFGARLRLAHIVMALVASVSLAACGGGGSGNTVVDKPGVALYTSAPSEITVPYGQSATYTISGGGGGSKFVSYSVASSNQNVATVSISDSNKFTIIGKGGGQATINVTDSAGANISITVNVNVVAGTPLTVNVPDLVTLSPGMSSQFVIIGGLGPFSSVSSNPRAIVTGVTNGAVVVTAANEGKATVVVFDKLGNAKEFEVVVPEAPVKPRPDLYTTAPASIKLPSGTTADYLVNGGTAPYTVTTSDPTVISGSFNGNTLTVRANAAGSGNINVRDAEGKLVVISATVSSENVATLYTTAPEAVTIGLGAGPSYAIKGGIGPFTATSSNVNVATATIQEGRNLSISGVHGGNASIVVFDSNGDSVKVAVTVDAGPGQLPVGLYTTAPGSVILPVGATTEYVVKGGVAPYVATSSNAATMVATITGNTLVLQANAVGTADINIRDEAGTLIELDATITGQAPAQMYTTAPETLAVSLGQSPSFSINGGVGPFTVTTSNASVVSGTIIDERTLRISGIAAGVGDIVVFDSTGHFQKIAVTVEGGTGNVPLYTTAPDSITVMIGSAPNYTIAGGSSPYVVTSSDVTIVRVMQSGNSFSTAGIKAGTAVVSIRDANGKAVTIEVTVR